MPSKKLVTDAQQIRNRVGETELAGSHALWSYSQGHSHHGLSMEALCSSAWLPSALSSMFMEPPVIKSEVQKRQGTGLRFSSSGGHPGA